MLSETPPVWKGSSKLFRNLKERGKLTSVLTYFKTDTMLFILFIFISLLLNVTVKYVCVYREKTEKKNKILMMISG